MLSWRPTPPPPVLAVAAGARGEHGLALAERAGHDLLRRLQGPRVQQHPEREQADDGHGPPRDLRAGLGRGDVGRIRPGRRCRRRGGRLGPPGRRGRGRRGCRARRGDGRRDRGARLRGATFGRGPLATVRRQAQGRAPLPRALEEVLGDLGQRRSFRRSAGVSGGNTRASVRPSGNLPLPVGGGGRPSPGAPRRARPAACGLRRGRVLRTRRAPREPGLGRSTAWADRARSRVACEQFHEVGIDGFAGLGTDQADDRRDRPDTEPPLDHRAAQGPTARA